MTDFDTFINDRILGIRNMVEVDLSGLNDAAVATGASFIHNDMVFLVVPTAGDDVLMVDVIGFVNGKKREQRTMMLRDR